MGETIGVWHRIAPKNCILACNPSDIRFLTWVDSVSGLPNSNFRNQGIFVKNQEFFSRIFFLNQEKNQECFFDTQQSFDDLYLITSDF